MKNSTMTQISGSLYGQAIGSEADGNSLVSQVVTILQEEIRRGRWEVGERLPAVSELARTSGINRGTLQYAFEKLAELGCFRLERYRGAFLVSREPADDRVKADVIGVLASNKFDNDPILHAWHYRLQLRHILELAGERGFSVQVQTFNAQEAGRSEDLIGLFHGRLAGVISLNEIAHEYNEALGEQDMPIVFWRDCFHVAGCIPFVGHDQPAAFYMMTRELIRRGHRKIAYLPQSLAYEMVVYPVDAELAHLEVAARFDGYARAMEEAELPLHPNAAEFEVRDLNGLRQLLEAYEQPTALVCGAGHIAWKIVMMAQMMSLRIPEDMSLVAPGPACIQDNGPMRLIGGADFDGAYGADLCFRLIEEQNRLRRINATRILLGPHFVEGCTIAPPRN
jgi:DNA-binding LacI/PurR family transcriptional regulator